MQFEEGHLYHIYNQGNNHQPVFFCNENYLFFLRKIETHVLPYADILAWCLMPNHFHLMVYVHTLSHTVGVTAVTQGSCTVAPTEGIADGATSSHPVSKIKRTFNESIGIMLRSYTRAVNVQEKRSGALFREETKAVCLTQSFGITRSWFNVNGITEMNVQISETQYPAICFNYILNNPVKDGLVNNHGDWDFSSYKELYGNKEKKFINMNRIKEFILLSG